MKNFLAYIILLIMVMQMLPQSLFEQETETVMVMKKSQAIEDNVKEKENKENKIAAIYTFHIQGIVEDTAQLLHYHAPLIVPHKKEVATPPPNIC